MFNGHMKNSPEKVELITVFDKNYNLKNIKNSSALLRVDFVIDEVTFNNENEQLGDFQWNSTTLKDKINNSLAEAIRNTLQEPTVSPKGKILYSYYIKLGNNSKSE
jgi:phage pi2 protein 07